jgi:5'-nucleotidase / UDP-sugar diphosphatase
MKHFCYFIPVLMISFLPAVWAETVGRQARGSFVVIHVNDTHSQFCPRHVTFRFPGVDNPVRVVPGPVVRMDLI